MSLAALWAFAAWVTVREGVNLLWVATLDSQVSQPTDALLPELQKERRLSLVRLASPAQQQRSALNEQRGRTDRAKDRLARLARGTRVEMAASPELEQHLASTIRRLNVLEETRKDIDAGLIDRNRAAQAYTDVIDSVFQVYDSLATLDDKDFAQDTRTLIAMNRAREVLSQEDAILTGALATRRLSSADYAQFVQMVGVRRHDTAQALLKLQISDRAAYQQLSQSESLERVRVIEDQIIVKGRSTERASISPSDWQEVTDPALTEMYRAVYTAGDRLVERATPIAAGVILRLVLAGGLGLFAVIASIVVSVTTARAIVRQLGKLRSAARQLAHERLPSVVERLGRGEQVDVEAEAPPLEFGTDEIGQVGQVFNTVQETAIRVAVEQAELRRGIRDILLSLARRTQVLVHQQLTLLDAMERRETTTEELQDLFRVDHLATRMRRNAENLIVLSGATPARGWRRSMPMIDVVRGAVAEVEDYTRVNVLPVGSVSLVGRAVGDVTHLMAELIENAVSFSPPYTTVQISGHLVANGYAVEIEDRGLGMSEEKLAAANERIISPQEINLSSDTRLGLYVVSRLAGRYGIRVSLKRSSYGGTTAVILLPREVVTEDDAAPKTAPAGGGAPALTAAGTSPHGLPVRGSTTAKTAVKPESNGKAPGSGDQRIGVVGMMANGKGPGGATITPDHVSGNGFAPADPAHPHDAHDPPDTRDASGGHDATAVAGVDELAGVVDGLADDLPDGVDAATGTDELAGADELAGTDDPNGADGWGDGLDFGGPGTGNGSYGLGATELAGPGPAGPSDGAQETAPPSGQGGARTQHGPQARQPDQSETMRTPSGLPFRVPQNNMAAPLRDGGQDKAKAQRPADDKDAARSPEEIRRIVGSYQRGTERGRSDAASSLGQGQDADGDGTPPSWPPTQDQDEPQG